MTKIERTQLLVAGGGPVGLLAALCAQKQGLDVIVIERSFRGTPRGHTTLLHPSSIRILAELGLSPLLLKAGRLIDEIDLRVERDRQRLKLPYPALAITQAIFEETLLKVLRRAEVDIRGTCEVTSLTQRDEQVEVAVARRELTNASSRVADEQWELTESSSIQAEFVIGADGCSSRVRRELGIRCVTRPRERYAMFEYPSERLSLAELVIAESGSELIIPLPDGRARASFQLAQTASPTPDLALLTTLLAERVQSQERPSDLHWSAIVDFEPALAEVSGRDRVWLAGDAAHSASPLGVQSMNHGLFEAWQTTHLISAVAAGKEPVAALMRLARVQRQDWLRTLGIGADFELLSHAPPWLAGHVQRVVAALPVSGSDLEAVFQQLGIARAR